MELESYLRFVLALVFVLALIGVLALIARRFNIGMPATVRLGGKRRLAVIEVLSLDTRRRLVLLRRDRTEHLVLLGPSTELLIESGIPAPGDAAAETPSAEAKR